MRLSKIRDDHGMIRWAVQREADTTALPEHESLGSLLARGEEELNRFLAAVDGPTVDRADIDGHLAAPVDDDTEIWAAGVTYQVSRQAREAESEQSGDVYRQVYDADRPELFFKAAGWRSVGPGAPIGIRQDSHWNVPEPELAIVANAAGDIVGYTVCNDVSSRSIEGTNPLYLPQAKVYTASCAMGPSIVLRSAIADPYDLALAVRIDRNSDTLYAAQASTGLLDRSLDELVDWLFAAQEFPRGAVLSTGTCLVPPDDVTLAAGDVVTIDISHIGTLTNPVVQVGTTISANGRRDRRSAPRPDA